MTGRSASDSSSSADDLRAVRSRLLDPERGCHALALDGDKHQVNSLTSNIGHLLWSGILDDGEAAATAERLLDRSSTRVGRAHAGRTRPATTRLGYHTGTIWPHDNSLIAAGLARYGHRDAAGTIASAILAAAPYFEHRLPEVFAGFPFPLTSVPVRFPTASRPQAWAAGAPLMLLTTLLNLRPGQTNGGSELRDPSGQISIARRPDQPPQPPTPAMVWDMDDREIATLVTRLSRPHRSGGIVIERAAILAAGADFPAVMDWIMAHAGTPETTVIRRRSRGLHAHG